MLRLLRFLVSLPQEPKAGLGESLGELGADRSADSVLEYSCWSRDFNSAVRLYFTMGREHFAQCLHLLSYSKPLFCASLISVWSLIEFGFSFGA